MDRTMNRLVWFQVGKTVYVKGINGYDLYRQTKDIFSNTYWAHHGWLSDRQVEGLDRTVGSQSMVKPCEVKGGVE